jgi:molecular chaperone GrpE (heat shock protein)
MLSNIEISDFKLQQKIEALLEELNMEARHHSYNGYCKYREVAEVQKELHTVIMQSLLDRDLEIERLQKELVPYHRRDSVEAHNAKQKAKVEFVLDLLFPHDSYDKGGVPRELRHPEKYWWWNGWSLLEESDPNEVTGNISVEVESYIGGGENEKFSFDILGEWIEPDDHEEIKARVHAWCRTSYAERQQADQAKQRKDAQRQIEEAQRTIDRLSGKA